MLFVIQRCRRCDVWIRRDIKLLGDKLQMNIREFQVNRGNQQPEQGQEQQRDREYPVTAKSSVEAEIPQPPVESTGENVGQNSVSM
jgi:hypothetical protein